MRFRIQWAEKLLAMAFFLALGGVPGSAIAETVTLQCGPAGQQGSLTLDVDFDRQTVFIANGNPPRSVNALIEARFITFDNPYIRSRIRIDRISGGLNSFTDGNWYAGGTCEKLASGNKLKF